MERLLLQAVAPFPVAGDASFVHDWGFPRWTPTPHLHQGTDIFADFGTPIVTSESGRVIAKGTAGAGGISVWVRGDSGMAYYYAHLQNWAPGLQVGQRVEMGTVIGFVGDSGNARGGAPHLHFQTHPGGGPGTPPRDPKPFLDDALRQAEERALALVSGARVRINTNGPAVLPGIRITKRVDQLFASAAGVQQPGDLMWFSLLDPTLGVLGLARQSAATAGGPTRQVSPRQLEEEGRRAEVRRAVEAPTVKLVNFAGKPVFDEMILSVTRPTDLPPADAGLYNPGD